MAAITINVCDMCVENNEAIESFTLTQGNKSRQVDLCDIHAAPLREAFSKGKTASASRKKSGKRSTSRLNITSLEDIERGKSG